MTAAEREQAACFEQAVRMLWKRGESTYEISRRWCGVSEAEVANTLHRLMDQEEGKCGMQSREQA